MKRYRSNAGGRRLQALAALTRLAPLCPPASFSLDVEGKGV